MQAKGPRRVDQIQISDLCLWWRTRRKNVHLCIRQTPRHKPWMQWFQETWGQCTRPPAGGAIHAIQPTPFRWSEEPVHKNYSVQLAIGCESGIYQKFKQRIEKTTV
jgi:hypothetical protein